jgi:hypothetical protein
MKHITHAFLVLKGLPTDDEIRGWMLKLTLCIGEIDSDIDYDVCGEEWEEIYAHSRQRKEPYINALNALRALVD